MATTNYIDNSLPTIGAAWLNDVDAAVYEGLLGATTPAAIITALALSPTNTPTFAGVVLPALGLVDGRDVSVDGAKLDTISSGAGPSSNSFVNIAVATQGTVIATTPTDTLTLVAGANIGITTVAGTDTITLAVPGTTAATVSTLAARDASGVLRAVTPAGAVADDAVVNRSYYLANFPAAAAVRGTTWTNLLASRVITTTYTNTTGKTIVVNAGAIHAGGSVSEINGIVAGVKTSRQVTSATVEVTQLSCSMEVPSGQTYSVDASGAGAAGWSLVLWAELI